MQSLPGVVLGVLGVLCVLSVLGVVSLSAQFQMPDAKEMSGIPRPVDDLPSGSVSVRLIRGDLSQNIANHPVELHVGEEVQTTNTDDGGRAQFDRLPGGVPLKAVAVVDGERLESEEFAALPDAGIRLMLVATDREKEARAAAEANAPPIPGDVVFNDRSRIVIEPGDETIELYYILTVENRAKAPVDPKTPFVFDMPTGAIGTTILSGSSEKASTSGARVRFAGPFPPGETILQVAASLPVTGGTVELSQSFPASMPQLNVIAQKLGDMRLTSPQIARQQDMSSNGEAYIAAAGGAVPAGQPIVLTLTGLPHHSTVPRWTALSIAMVITFVGVWGIVRPGDQSRRQDERQRLTARREKLLQELVRLENDRLAGRGDRARQAGRREELVASLEHVYAALDADDVAEGPSPQSADRSGYAR
jgi:hypothetical protein